MQEEVGKLKIGVLAIQGSIVEHVRAVEAAGAIAVPVKLKKDLDEVVGLIIPGGESTTIGKLLKRFGLDEEIRRRVTEGMPIYGTCAGAILMANEIMGRQIVDGLNLMDISVERNAYGRQIDSFVTEVDFVFGKKKHRIPAVFIRAPKIVTVGDEVEVISKIGEDIIAAKQGNMMVSTFHPEMTEDISVHEYFVDLCDEVVS